MFENDIATKETIPLQILEATILPSKVNLC